MPPQ
jgi:hypothetical protein